MYQNFIAHLKKYISLNDDEVDLLLSGVKPLNLAKKEFLLKEGQVCKANYFVEQGLLRMFFINNKGVEQNTQFALENWWIADHMSLMKQAGSHFYIQSVEASAIIAIEYHKQDQLLAQLPQLERYFMIMMQRAYAASQMRVKFFHVYSKEENYRQFVTSFPDFVQRIPQYMLASYLGLTPEYVSELRKKQ
ncbi:cAMP-binding domain of CRP or a regulatory subunit of cAMP-dependent protein kinases [Pedobacter westerhofensis]|uniref:cAMP-binding domain of CRP or a regulatory subunit of cAMP-dependent protein kinases n=1 Tax=Pedobacter westerhofensis TaxID=425512 RepID=A0A521ATE1_9SPHI|nr:Crp/Fnr family transcriptional regulator [Pedobacter westerhofensis]SMO38076.1 cAMP-binding domain of CRP or a regulatory subunit of cAMP-dependent protein kinases [Pedobacter westerhofensis]